MCIVHVLVCLALVACTVMALAPKPYGHAWRLFVYDQDDLSRALKAIGLESFGRARSLERNGAGTELRLSGYSAPGNQLLRLHLDGTYTVERPPARFWHMNDAGAFVAWFDDIKNGVTLRDGRVVTPRLHGRFGVDPSGVAYFVERQPAVTAVGLVDGGAKEVEIAGFVGFGLFSDSERLFVFGLTEDVFRADNKDSIQGYAIRVGDPLLVERKFRIVRPKPGPSPFQVVDMDPSSGEVLIVDIGDLLASRWYLFDPRTEVLRKVGRIEGWALYLQGDVLDAVARRATASKP